MIEVAYGLVGITVARAVWRAMPAPREPWWVLVAAMDGAIWPIVALIALHNELTAFEDFSA
jgi:hypothetical protein